MYIDDKQLGNVGMALARYSEYLNDNKPADGLLLEYWELTRREVWALRNDIKQYYNTLPSSTELAEEQL